MTVNIQVNGKRIKGMGGVRGGVRWYISMESGTRVNRKKTKGKGKAKGYPRIVSGMTTIGKLIKGTEQEK